jgi:hypothetical protein
MIPLVRLQSLPNRRCALGILSPNFLRPHSFKPSLQRCRLGCLGPLIALLLGTPFACCSGVLVAQTVGAISSTKPTKSLADSLQRVGGKQLHILYLHGIASNGPGDYDSWLLRKGICDFLKDCVSPAGELDGKTEYADQEEFKLNAPPPALKYLGSPVWETDPSGPTSQEWNAAAPFVVHWKLARSSGPAIFVDEINWWPLVFSLKCRQIIRSDASLLGPNADRIKLCSTRKADVSIPGRFISYDWIDTQEAHTLLALESRGALVNRKLKGGLLDWGFSDAVLALGPMRTYLLDGIRQLILKSVGISPDSSREGPAVPIADQEFVVVSHSLGSYLIFSALDINPAMPKTASLQRTAEAYEQVLSRTSLVYFFANQLRLLGLADLDGESEQDMASHLEAWGKLRCDYLKSSPDSTQTCERPQIVALNDPSDLLTWTIPELKSVEVHNVIVKNATHWLWLIESPTRAHDNYARDKSAIRQMLRLTKP